MKIKYFILHLFVLVSFLPVFSQAYWQQEVNYKINVTLNDQQHSIKGTINFEYINHSPDELSFLWIHVWPNAYKNKETALYKQVASDKEGRKRLKAFKERGFIDSLFFTVGNIACKTEPHPQYIDVIKIILPSPLSPGGKVNITTPFFEQIPGYFSRLGHSDNYYMISQWYPKPAVYDSKGWHEMPYLDQGEFYSEFGSFDVTITTPPEYIIGATGDLQTESELLAYKKSGSENRKIIDNAIAGVTDEKQIQDALKKIKPVRTDITTSAGYKTLRFTETNVHDFAWFASKDFVLQYDTITLPSGKIADVFSFYNYFSTAQWYKSSYYIKDAVLHYSNWLGEYPYNSVKAAEGPINQTSGGMEYPTITMITSPDANQERLDAVITHEVGHNWFYGILASNERDHPWMDEGVNTYLQFRYEAEKYKSNSIFGNAIPAALREKSVGDFQAIIYNIINQNFDMDEPISTASANFSNKENYGLVVYLKTAVWMYVLEVITSRETVDKALKAYYNTWKFRHPYPEDFKAAFVLASNINLNDFFELLNKKGKVTK